jgi:ATP-dependent RNA helicase DDX56/DBP9
MGNQELMGWQGIYDIIIASDEKSELFGDEAAEAEGEKKEPKKSKNKDGEEGTAQPKKKRKHRKDEEYGVSRGMRTRLFLTSAY